LLRSQRNPGPGWVDAWINKKDPQIKSVGIADLQAEEEVGQRDTDGPALEYLPSPSVEAYRRQ